MKMMRLSHFAILLVFVSRSYQQILAPGCQMSLDELDRCALKLSYIGDRNLTLPTNNDEMDQHCREMYDSMACVRRFLKTCLVKYAKDLFGIFLYDLRREIKKRCKTQKGREEFMKHMACYKENRAERMEPVHKCMDAFVVQNEWILQNVEKKDHIISICCAFHQSQSCFKDRISSACDSVTGPETTQYIDDLVSTYAKESIDFTCGSFKDLQACDKSFKPEIWKPLSELGANSEQASFKGKYHSPMTPAITLFNQFE